MIPDRLPDALRDVIAKFPRGSLQFEVGIQTFNGDVGALIKRRQNYDRLAENFAFLREQTGVYIHADLIVGLPGETLESFAAGFDRLIQLRPHEIQVGILKRLRGTPIVRHDEQWQMVYSSNPPYEVLQNKLVDFSTMQRLRRFARYWDLVGNSGNFAETTPLIWSPNNSPFTAFMKWSDWLHAKINRTDSISLVRLMELLFEFLAGELNLEKTRVAQALFQDYCRAGRNDKPTFLKNFLTDEVRPATRKEKTTLPKRQSRHLVGETD
jgi:hypothetical protein